MLAYRAFAIARNIERSSLRRAFHTVHIVPELDHSGRILVRCTRDHDSSVWHAAYATRAALAASQYFQAGERAMTRCQARAHLLAVVR